MKLNAQAIAERFASVSWHSIMSLADRVAPSVGTMVIESGQFLQDVQQKCPDHRVRHLVLCRGTDRYVGPNKTLFPGEAPLRRMICIRRKIGDVQVHKDWEPWERLTQRGLRRKSLAARVSLTIFAQAKPLTELGETPHADAGVPAMPEASHPRPELTESERASKRVCLEQPHKLPDGVPEVMASHEDPSSNIQMPITNPHVNLNLPDN